VISRKVHTEPYVSGSRSDFSAQIMGRDSCRSRTKWSLYEKDYEHTKFFRVVTLGAALSAMGFLAIRVAIKYYQSTREYVATAEVGVDGETVHRTAVKEAEARSPTVKNRQAR
jgi:hypothetical protein